VWKHLTDDGEERKGKKGKRRKKEGWEV